jgi:transcriptional antiterminator RfaH
MQQWHVVHTKPQREVLVHDQLERRGLESYLPLFRFERGYSRGIRFEPVFPQYLFVKVDLTANEANGIRWLAGVRFILHFGHQAAVVPESTMKHLQTQLEPVTDRVLRKNEWLFQSGQKVRVINGPFQGLEAIFQKGLNGTDRVQILLNFLGSWVRADLDVTSIEAQ